MTPPPPPAITSSHLGCSIKSRGYPKMGQKILSLEALKLALLPNQSGDKSTSFHACHQQLSRRCNFLTLWNWSECGPYWLDCVHFLLLLACAHSLPLEVELYLNGNIIRGRRRRKREFTPTVTQGWLCGRAIFMFRCPNGFQVMHPFFPTLARWGGGNSPFPKLNSSVVQDHWLLHQELWPHGEHFHKENICVRIFGFRIRSAASWLFWFQQTCSKFKGKRFHWFRVSLDGGWKLQVTWLVVNPTGLK